VLFAYLFRGTTTAQTVRPLLGGARAQAKSFSCKAFADLARSVLGVILAMGSLYGAVFPFEVVADDMLQKDYGYSPDNAGFLLTSVPLVSLASPLVQPWLGSVPGKQLCSGATAFVVMVAAQVVLALQQPWSPMVGFALMGVGYVVAACSLWIVLPGLVRESVPAESAKEVEGLATGLCYAMLATFQFVSNYVAGVIKDDRSYQCVCAWFAALAGAGFLFVLVALGCRRPIASATRSTSSTREALPREVSGLTPSAAAADEAMDPPKASNVELSSSVLQEDYYIS